MHYSNTRKANILNYYKVKSWLILVLKCTPTGKFKNILKINSWTEKINNTHMSVQLMNHREMKMRSILSWKEGEKRTTTGGQHQSGLARHFTEKPLNRMRTQQGWILVCCWNMSFNIFKTETKILPDSRYISRFKYIKWCQRRNTGCPHDPKAEHSYGTFSKPKWHKARKQLPSIYTEKVLSVPIPISLRLLWYLRTHRVKRCTK